MVEEKELEQPIPRAFSQLLSINDGLEHRTKLGRKFTLAVN